MRFFLMFAVLTAVVFQAHCKHLHTGKAKALKGSSEEVEEEYGKSKSEEDELISGSQEALEEFDPKTGITGMYVPETDECYLIAGSNLNENEAGTGGEGEGGEGGAGGEGDTSAGGEPVEESLDWDEEDFGEEPTLQKTNDQPIKDKSVIPKGLKSVCKDKETFWADYSFGNEGNESRKKRCTEVPKAFIYCCDKDATGKCIERCIHHFVIKINC